MARSAPAWKAGAAGAADWVPAGFLGLVVITLGIYCSTERGQGSIA
jgi:hypothetical protein